jgi:hypothetical protein
VLRRRGGALDVVTSVGQGVPRERSGVAGAFTRIQRPLIGPSGEVVFQGEGLGFANFYLARPAALLPAALLPFPDWSTDADAFDYDVAADGTVAIRAAAQGFSGADLYRVTPGGVVTPIVQGRRDIHPIARPAFGPGGRLYFLAENRDLPADSSGQFQSGLYRSRPGDAGPVPVVAPGAVVPGWENARVIGLTQRPVVSAQEIAYGVIFGWPQPTSVPTAALFRMPLDATLATAALAAPEGHPIRDAERLALLQEVASRGDGTPIFSGLLAGAGPLIAPPSGSAPAPGLAGTRSLAPGQLVVPLVKTGDGLGPGKLEAVLPPLVSHRLDRVAFLGRASLSEPRAPDKEGLLTVAHGSADVDPVAVSQDPVRDRPGRFFERLVDTPLLKLNPVSTAPDGSVLFKALLHPAGSGSGSDLLFGLFHRRGAGDPATVALSVDALTSSVPRPHEFERWMLDKAGRIYVKARPAGGKAILFQGAGGTLRPFIVPGQTLTAEGAVLTDLEDFILSAGDDVFILGSAGALPGVFRVEGNRLARVAVNGDPAPAYLNGKTRLDMRFQAPFALHPSSIRGNLIFRAMVAGPRGERREAEFHYLRTAGGGRVEGRVVPGIGVEGARLLSVETFGDTLSGQTVNGFTVSAARVGGRWRIVRWRLSPEGRLLDEIIAEEGQRLKDGQTLMALNVAPLLELVALPRRDGPAFTINDAGDVSFLAADRLSWGIYRVGSGEINRPR